MPREIARGVGVQPAAYAFPFGDFGQYQHRAIMTRPINLGLVEQRYRLAFLLGNLALNTREGDPRRLNRLLVRPGWSGLDLVDRLERAWPAEAPILEKDGRPVASVWIVDWGHLEQDRGGSLVMHAATNATGAKMWLAGSDISRDFYFRLGFQIEHGQLGIFLRASPDGESYVYLGLDPAGEVWLRQLTEGRERLPISEEADDTGIWLRQKFVGAERFTLASSRVPIRSGGTHTLEVYLRDRLLVARLDGREVFQSRGMLRGAVRPGMVGLSVWSPHQGQARVRLLGVEVREQTPRAAVFIAGQPHEPHTFHWVFANAFQFTDLCPIWRDDRMARPDFWSAPPEDIQTYRLLARVNHLRLEPQLIMDSDRTLQRHPPAAVAEKAARYKFDGVLVNFSPLRDVSLPTLATWVRQCAAALSTNGLRLLVQLPRALETRAQVSSLLSVVPGARVVVDARSPQATGEVGRLPGIVRIETAPEPSKDEEIPLFFTIPPSKEGMVVETPAAKGSRLQQEGLTAFLEGGYDRAIELWSEWEEIEPDNPKIHMLIGDAFARKGDLRRAVERYNRSLDLDPGQITLAIRRAGVLTLLGESAAAMESLNLYARLFPGNPDILLAQARWLNDHQRPDEAAEAARKLLAVRPGHVEALAMLIRLTRSPEEYQRRMAELEEVALRPESHLSFAQAAWKNELTALPGAGGLLAALRRIASVAKDPVIVELCGRVLPNPQPAVETFRGGQISARWWVDGGVLSPLSAGGARLQTTEAHSETSMRLLGSLHYHDGLVEAEVSGVEGSLWLFARRTLEHLVRFGISENMLHLQVWNRGRLVQESKREWSPPVGRFRLRLETSGQGAMGFVNGEPAFNARLNIPRDLGPGWLGIAVHDVRKGRAAVELRRLVGGSTAPRLAVLPPAAGADEADAQLAAIQRDAISLTAICPTWYTIEADGRWIAAAGLDPKVFGMFCKYHRLWLLPFVECRSYAAVLAADLEQRARETGAAGFVLAFKTWPGDRAVADLAERLRGLNLNVFVLAFDADARSARLHAVAGLSATSAAPSAELKVVRRSAFQPEEFQGFDGWLIGY